MHNFRLFTNRDYGLFVVYHDNALVHYSGIFPPYFRFPFMEKDDLQIGNVWTCPNHRGRGIASFAIQAIIESELKPGRKIWYIVEKNNTPSIRVIEKAGFACVGHGTRTKRFGIRILGSFVITNHVGFQPVAGSAEL
jgi:RimJ/RimL family protein N-acetyltransferase